MTLIFVNKETAVLGMQTVPAHVFLLLSPCCSLGLCTKRNIKAVELSKAAVVGHRLRHKNQEKNTVAILAKPVPHAWRVGMCSSVISLPN